MPLVAGCPRCALPVVESDAVFACPEHARVEPLWRPDEVSYETFAEHLLFSQSWPTYLPWPIPPGWSVSDFAVVGHSAGRPRATMTCCSGATQLDGPVDVLVVVEEVGTGLGARCAGTLHDDPGADIGDGPPAVRVRIDNKQVPLWAVSTSAATADWDRSVVAGEAHGRWLWIVVRPASAVLLLGDDWILRDVSGLGAALLELPFGGPTPPW